MMTSQLANFEKEMLEFLLEASPTDPRREITTHWLSRLRVWRMREAGDDHPALYDVARDVCHELGMPWTDPRTGVTFEPPEKTAP
jgi:hypothetical protein